MRSFAREASDRYCAGQVFDRAFVKKIAADSEDS
jgi:hypothetical protein